MKVWEGNFEIRSEQSRLRRNLGLYVAEVVVYNRCWREARRRRRRERNGRDKKEEAGGSEVDGSGDTTLASTSSRGSCSLSLSKSSVKAIFCVPAQTDKTEGGKHQETAVIRSQDRKANREET